MIYDVTVSYDDTLYDFEILARNGNVINMETKKIGTGQENSDQAAPSQNDIGMDKAREIALSNVSGASEDSVKKMDVDTDHGKLVYEIEIVYDGMEYDFEIDGVTGDIISRGAESVHN